MRCEKEGNEIHLDKRFHIDSEGTLTHLEAIHGEKANVETKKFCVELQVEPPEEEYGGEYYDYGYGDDYSSSGDDTNGDQGVTNDISEGESQKDTCPNREPTHHVQVFSCASRLRQIPKCCKVNETLNTRYY